jgi:hypothetical protein
MGDDKAKKKKRKKKKKESRNKFLAHAVPQKVSTSSVKGISGVFRTFFYTMTMTNSTTMKN